MDGEPQPHLTAEAARKQAQGAKDREEAAANEQADRALRFCLGQVGDAASEGRLQVAIPASRLAPFGLTQGGEGEAPGVRQALLRKLHALGYEAQAPGNRLEIDFSGKPRPRHLMEERSP